MNPYANKKLHRMNVSQGSFWLLSELGELKHAKKAEL